MTQKELFQKLSQVRAPEYEKEYSREHIITKSNVYIPFNPDDIKKNCEALKSKAKSILYLTEQKLKLTEFAVLYYQLYNTILKFTIETKKEFPEYVPVFHWHTRFNDYNWNPDFAGMKPTDEDLKKLSEETLSKASLYDRILFEKLSSLYKNTVYSNIFEATFRFIEFEFYFNLAATVLIGEEIDKMLAEYDHFDEYTPINFSIKVSPAKPSSTKEIMSGAAGNTSTANTNQPGHSNTDITSYNSAYNRAFKENMNVKEAAEYLGFKKSYIYQLTSSKKIPCYKPGKKLFFLKKDLDKWIESKKVKTDAELKEEAIKHTNKNRNK
jgi:excisionase family DNA binding protein